MRLAKRNYCWRLTLKAYSIGMPFRWWRAWFLALWRTRQWPRLRRVGMAWLHRHSAAVLLNIPVDAARRRRRFGSEIEAQRSWARSHNAGLARRIADGRERIAELQRRAAEMSHA